MEYSVLDVSFWSCILYGFAYAMFLPFSFIAKNFVVIELKGRYYMT